MRILLSNDDGILAAGLAALRAAVAAIGEVTVVAPDSAQSAAGHGITLAEPLVVRRVQLDSTDGAEGFAGISVDGRPADCVRLAIRKLLPAPPDLVLTGINAGANVGVNVFYSGTVAAAAEAAMLDIPAVAFSAEASGELDFRRIGYLCRWVLDMLLADGLERGDLINVNIPRLGPSLPRGLRVVRQSTAEVEDAYHRRQDPPGAESYQLGRDFRFAPGRADTDVACLAEGYITVTPLHVDMTNHAKVQALANRRWGDVPKQLS